MISDTDKERSVELAITQIEKQFGKGSIMRLGGDEFISNVP
ncbi:MAG: DNA recombination/repair protein RecA, partial [Syntrophobacterales bacterium]|nr:DNA recombination/repair protein RecA [Syntrophobacterales bacterium]